MPTCSTTKIFAGQGQIYLKPFDDSDDYLPLGNTPEFAINMDQTFLDIKESCTGTRGDIAHIPTEANVNVSISGNNFDKKVLARALYGAASTVSGTTVTNESLTFQAVNGFQPLAHPHVQGGSPQIVINQSGSPNTLLVRDTDYSIDLESGVVKLLSSSNLTGAAPWTLEADYTYADYDKTEALTDVITNYGLIFQGINLADKNYVRIQVHKIALDLAAALNFISTDEFVLTMTGKVLADATQGTGLSQYFVITDNNV